MDTLRQVYARLKFGAVCALILVAGFFIGPHLREKPFSPISPVAKAPVRGNVDYSPVGVAHPRKKPRKAVAPAQD